MFSNSSDISYMKLIEMDEETDQNLPRVASKSYTLLVEHHKWVQKELEYLEKTKLFQ